MRVLIKELNPECLDTAGHTPLMYAVYGRQPKVGYPHSFHTITPIKSYTIELPPVAENGSKCQCSQSRRSNSSIDSHYIGI